MISVLADQQIELAYFRDPLCIEAIDEEELVADLTDGVGPTGASRRLSQIRLTDYDHLVVATDRREGRAVAVLAAHDCKTTHEPFLLVDLAFMRPDVRDGRLLRRMTAALLLRIAGLDVVPTVVAACVSDGDWFDTLRSFGAGFNGAACFPPPPGAPVQLRSAALAQRVARALRPTIRFETATGALRGGLAARGGIGSTCSAGAKGIDCLMPSDELLLLIDLRTETEAGIVEDARRAYRGR